MSESLRFYHCSLCEAKVVICSRCDRGHRYCNRNCRVIARRASLKRAAIKYQNSFRGRIKNAARQQRFLYRRNKKITHHRSKRFIVYGVVKTRPSNTLTLPQNNKNLGLTKCHFCFRRVPGPLRLSFLHSGHTKFMYSSNFLDSDGDSTT